MVIEMKYDQEKCDIPFRHKIFISMHDLVARGASPHLIWMSRYY